MWAWLICRNPGKCQQCERQVLCRAGGFALVAGAEPEVGPCCLKKEEAKREEFEESHDARDFVLWD